MSARGYCPEHGDELMMDNLQQLRDHRGPMFEHWYEQIRLAFEHPRWTSSD